MHSSILHMNFRRVSFNVMNETGLDHRTNKIDINRCPECLGTRLTELDLRQFSIYHKKCTSHDNESRIWRNNRIDGGKNFNHLRHWESVIGFIWKEGFVNLWKSENKKDIVFVAFLINFKISKIYVIIERIVKFLYHSHIYLFPSWTNSLPSLVHRNLFLFSSDHAFSLKSANDYAEFSLSRFSTGRNIEIVALQKIAVGGRRTSVVSWRLSRDR